MSATLLGREHDREGAISGAAAGPSWACAMSTGGPNRKPHPNEDACGARVEGERAIAVVADAHFGAAAAEEAVAAVLDGTAPGLGAFPEREIAELLVDALRRAARRLDARGADGGSEAAAVALVLCGPRLRWVSVGDCRLYLVPAGRPEATRVLAPLGDSYLGRDPASVDEASSGSLELAPGDRIVVASDGLPECIYGTPTLEPAHVGRVAAAAGSALDAARALVAEALAKGGEDNVAVVVGDVG